MGPGGELRSSKRADQGPELRRELYQRIGRWSSRSTSGNKEAPATVQAWHATCISYGKYPRPRPLSGEARKAVSPMKARTVMCVDDDAGIRKLYGVLLGQNGYEVISASNGRHARHVFESEKAEIGAVILDYEMPGMNGLELAKWLKRRHPTLPVIMVSGSSPPLERMAPFVDAAIAKGVPFRNILDRLQVLLGVGRISASSPKSGFLPRAG